MNGTDEDESEDKLWSLDKDMTKGYTMINLHLMILDLVWLVWAETGDYASLEFLVDESRRAIPPMHKETIESVIARLKAKRLLAEPFPGRFQFLSDWRLSAPELADEDQVWGGR